MSVNRNLFVYQFQPLLFDDFELDNDLKTLLKRLIEMDHINLLLIGDAGSGKTSLLNAIIREYYQTPLTHTQMEENVLYINSLKEQGIHYYRNDVKTFCQTCSSVKHKKKIVVLDDIDCINEQSQQVFRNYIDKYSQHAHFISSCSNIQKVIESLQSRFMIVQVNCLHKDSLRKILWKIRDTEHIHITPEAEEFVLTVSHHSAKTLINYMEKFKLVGETITWELANHLCTNISFQSFETYIELLKTNQLFQAIHLFYEIYDRGYSVMDILDTFFLFVKTTRLLTEKQKYDMIPFICKYITVFYNVHEDEIELGLFTNNLIHVLQSVDI